MTGPGQIYNVAIEKFVLPVQTIAHSGINFIPGFEVWIVETLFIFGLDL